jgi:methoxymalonate biosynthesis acyl carrier protein
MMHMTMTNDATSNIDEISGRLRAFIVERFEISAVDPDFTDDIHLFDFGYVDSFGAVDLTRFVESTFGVEVSTSDMVAYPLNTIREIANFVARRQQGEI